MVAPLRSPGDAVIVGVGPHGERAASPRTVELSEKNAERARAAGFRVGIVLHTEKSDWSRQQLDGIRATLLEYSATVVGVMDSEFDASRQVAAIEELIAMKPDAIIRIPVDDARTVDAHRRIAEAGIKLVLMDNVPHGLEPGRDYVSVVSADNTGNGIIAAEILSRHVEHECTIGMIGFDADFLATSQRAAAFRDWFERNRPDVTLRETSFRDPPDARGVAAAFLAMSRDLAGLFVVWDAPALEAAAAAAELGLDIPITTVDLGEQAAIQIARNGPIKGVGAQQPYDQGVAEALVALNALLGRATAPWIAVPALAVTAANVLEAYERVWHAPAPAELVAASLAASSPHGART